MIPEFDSEGYLPAGLHLATTEEIDLRFGKESELRQVQMESLGWAIELAKRVGAERFVVNGSFVTDKLEPNDVDCVMLLGDLSLDEVAEAELLAGIPFINLELVDIEAFKVFTENTFATDRNAIPKGMIEVIL